ncbi:DUF4843 domain-containing protein [Pseudoflavitalea sp. G-6-1-2]|uniref:DUF4843 domain-containing protein n=1 Tax=Pseudoflavitalea sp. G-6-1-2 TaxID=2728841 RepID=UPI001469E371|nr:DUF4843 domain-containing protein [Pseudoflavitalea sp. G-6-1-2]NML21207.1 DUF4843 domain-containing protein [Pseudoflavitalea sp. G-6-1-2]
MKSGIFSITICCLFAAVAISCKQDQYYLFNHKARLQFGPPLNPPGTSYPTFMDTLKSATFYYYDNSKMVDTVYFDIYTIGKPASKDRKYTLQVYELPGVENAIAGQHYVAFDDASVKDLYVIKPDSVHARVPVIIKRTPELKNKSLSLGIRVKEDENFELGESSKLWRKLQFTDRLSRPDAWDEFASQYYWGPYSVAKHQYMINVTGFRWDNQYMDELSDEQVRYYRSFFQTSLIEYNKAHPDAPLKDEYGEPINFL